MTDKTTASDIAADMIGAFEGELSEVDKAAVIAFATQMARLLDARRRIDVEGLIVEDSKGFAGAHPALDIERAASAEMRGWVMRRPDLFGAGKRTEEGDDVLDDL